jgi:hypothetical protein
MRFEDAVRWATNILPGTVVLDMTPTSWFTLLAAVSM